MRLEYDPQANAIYIYLTDNTVARSRTVRKNTSNATVDYAADGSVVGVELLGVQRGVDVSGLPEAEEIAALLRQQGFMVAAKSKARSA